MPKCIPLALHERRIEDVERIIARIERGISHDADTHVLQKLAGLYDVLPPTCSQVHYKLTRANDVLTALREVAKVTRSREASSVS